MRLSPILLVEDDARDLKLTLIALERERLANEVVVARDGELALDYLNAEGAYAGRADGNPAVLLLDLKLPKVGGLEVLKHVRATDHLRHLPVVLLSSSNEESDRRQSRELGADAYVVKPVDLKEFMAAIAGMAAFWALARRSEPAA